MSNLPYKRKQPVFSLTSINPAQMLVIGFAAIILVGAFLLMLPIATPDGRGLSFVNALFTATSATCVTGLVVVDTGTAFTMFGQLTILTLIQVGGLGFMTMATLFALVIGRKISLRQRLLIQESLNQLTLEGIVKLVQRVLLFTIIFEGVGALILALRWIPDMGVSRGIYFGIFHSVSNFNNAGFDLVGGFRSLTPYVSDPIVNIVIMILIIAGGIGFIVIAELTDFHNRHKLSMHTKVVLTSTAFLVFFGALLIFAMEYTNPKTLASLDWAGKILGSFFQSVCTRTDGANTLPIGDMHQATLFLMVILMFIGASPGSTGGGIKTTTFVTLLGAVWAMIRGRRDVVFFKQRVDESKVHKALTITFAAVFLVLGATMILCITEKADFLTVLFETTSAFGTVGLSMGLTPHLTIFGKILLSFVMFAGRVGPLTVAFALSIDRKKENFRYSEGKITIG
jgi:trk system potassium uptake protein